MRLEELERELRGDRPEIDPAFANQLDEWAARGFPRGGELDPRPTLRARGAIGLPGPLRPIRERLRRMPPRRVLAPAGGVLALLVIVAVAITQIEQPSRDGAMSVTTQGARPIPPEEIQRGPADAADVPRSRGSGADFAGPAQRRVAQTIGLSLATAPEDFRDAADGVLDVVGDHNGYVLRSSVSGGDPDVEGAEVGRATFGLRIPAAQLQPALAALSDLGHLVSRTDGTHDITARFRSAQERIDTFAEARDRLLRRLENADTEAEQESIRRRLRIVESRLENARDDLARVQHRVRMVPVNVTVAADRSIRDGGPWGIGDALETAGRVLTVAAGVILISAAVLLPLALLIAVGWLTTSRVRRLQRERALGP